MAEDKDIQKGPEKDVQKGPEKDVQKGAASGGASANVVAQDVFRQVTGLGGFLIVAVVTPLASCGPSPSGSSARSTAMSTLKAKAESREEESARQTREIEERKIKLFEQTVARLGVQQKPAGK